MNPLLGDELTDPVNGRWRPRKVIQSNHQREKRQRTSTTRTILTSATALTMLFTAGCSDLNPTTPRLIHQEPPLPDVGGVKASPHAVEKNVILDCTTKAPGYSFSISQIPICGVKLVPAAALTNQPEAPEIPIDLVAFTNKMQELDNTTMGYAWALVRAKGPNAGIAAEGFSGSAVQEVTEDGGHGVGMNTETMANIGSASKLVSFVGFLRAFETLPPQYNPQHVNVDTFLTIPFLYFMPRRAQQYAHPSLAMITIGDLMRHESGINYGNPGTYEETLKTLLEKGVKDSDHGARVYANYNNVIIRWMLPSLESPSERAAIDKAQAKLDIDSLSASCDTHSRGYVSRYFAERLTPAIGGQFSISCSPEKINPNNVAFAYSTKKWPPRRSAPVPPDGSGI